MEGSPATREPDVTSGSSASDPGPQARWPSGTLRLSLPLCFLLLLVGVAPSKLDWAEWYSNLVAMVASMIAIVWGLVLTRPLAGRGHSHWWLISLAGCAGVLVWTFVPNDEQRAMGRAERLVERYVAAVNGYDCDTLWDVVGRALMRETKDEFCSKYENTTKAILLDLQIEEGAAGHVTVSFTTQACDSALDRTATFEHVWVIDAQTGDRIVHSNRRQLGHRPGCLLG
jgi:hypothetical protein